MALAAPEPRVRGVSVVKRGWCGSCLMKMSVKANVEVNGAGMG